MNDELAHEGDEGKFGGFTFGTEALVEGFQDRIVTCSDQRGHVECFSCKEASAGNAGFASVGAAVAVERCNADERGDLSAGEFAEFGHLGNKHVGGGFADAVDLFQGLDFL